MALIKVLSLFFGFLLIINPFSIIYARNSIENVPFDVQQVIEKVTSQQKPHHTDYRLQNRRYPHRKTENLQGEFMIDTTIVYGPAEEWQEAPSVAFDGSNYFVVWGDYELEAVVGTRVTPLGEVLDKPAIKIAEAETEWDEAPSVAFGENYLVVWAAPSGHNFDIFGARITPGGILLDTTPIAICTTEYEQFQASVAYDGSNFFVVWGDYDRNEIYGTRINPAGQILDSLSIRITNGFADAEYNPAISFDGNNYFVAWIDYRNSPTDEDVYGARVNSEGIVLDSAGIPISTANGSQRGPVITFGGSNYFVIWEDYRNSHYPDLYGTRVNRQGTVLDSAGIVITTGSYYEDNPSVAFDGTNYFAVWEERNEIYGARIDTTGIILDTNRINISPISVSYEWKPFAVFGETNYFVVWTDERLDSDIYGARVSTEGTVLDSLGILISMGVNKQTQPQMAFDGTNYLVVWEDYRGGDYDIYGARVNSTGTILDPTPIPISTATYDQMNPQVIFDGNYYFVVWDDTRTGDSDIYAARVNSDGVVLDTAGIPISTESYDQYSPKVTFGYNRYFIAWLDTRSGSYTDLYGTQIDTAGRVLFPYGIRISTTIDSVSSFQVIFDHARYFVVWEDTRGGYYYDIYGARVDISGNVLDPTGIPISNANSNQRFPQIVFGGNAFFVVWQDSRSGEYDIYGARVTTDGTVLEPEGIPVSTATSRQIFPRLVFDGTKYFVIWQDDRTMQSEIYGTRVNINGFVLDTTGIRISTAFLSATSPQLAFDGTNYVMVWEDYRNGNSDIFGAHVNTSGRVLDTFLVTNQPKAQRYPVIVHGAGNQTLIAYQGWTETIGGKGYNTDRIWGKFAPAPGIEETKISADINSPIFLSFPNPFNRSTTIRYTICKRGDVSLKVYDITGKLVRILVDENKKPGTYSIGWDGTDELKQKLPAGVYFYRLKTSAGNSETKELIILR